VYIYFEPESQRYIYGICLPLAVSAPNNASRFKNFLVDTPLRRERERERENNKKTSILQVYF
jgi:hypothetical protein